MICSASQIDSFWKTFVLSNDCESSIRANVTEPPRFGVAARDPRAAVVQRAERARRIARDRRRVRELTFTPSDGGGQACRVLYTSHPRPDNAQVPLPPDYVVIGAGAIGGTIGARLARGGRSVLLCDADHEHVAAINDRGLRIEGPVEEFSVNVPAVVPDELPDRRDALEAVAPRLAPDGFVVSLQNGVNEPLIASIVGEERTVGAFVNFGADYLEPGRIFVGGRGALYVGELDGRRSIRLEHLLHDLPDAKETSNILGFLWAKEAYGAMLFATAVSDLSIADALAEPRYRGIFVQLAREVLAAAPVPVEAFDGFDADDLDGSVDRLVEFNRRSAKTHSGIYRDLAVRKRKAETAILEDLEGPLLQR